MTIVDLWLFITPNIELFIYNNSILLKTSMKLNEYRGCLEILQIFSHTEAFTLILTEIPDILIRSNRW